MNKRIIPIASDFMQPHDRKKLIDAYNPIFNRHRLVQSSKPSPNSENYYFILSGGTENIFLKIINGADKSESIKIIAIGINNSLPAALEILAYVNQNDKQGKIYYLKDTKDHDGLSD